MRFLRLAASAIALFVSAMAYGQSPTNLISNSASQTPFDLMKTLAGNWQGSITTDSPAWATDKPIPLSIRVASHGNALIHELDTGGPEVTVIYTEGDRLALVHYCDFGNRPHMIAQPVKDGKVIQFTLLEAPGSNAVGHVSEGTFTIIDSKHHLENWVFLPKEGKPIHAHIEFRRVE